MVQDKMDFWFDSGVLKLLNWQWHLFILFFSSGSYIFKEKEWDLISERQEWQQCLYSPLLSRKREEHFLGLISNGFLLWLCGFGSWFNVSRFLHPLRKSLMFNFKFDFHSGILWKEIESHYKEYTMSCAATAERTALPKQSREKGEREKCVRALLLEEMFS